MCIAHQEIEEVRVDWRNVEFEIRSEQAKVARAIGSSVASLVARILKTPSALFGGRVATNAQA
ncbi:hypothetical protein SAMN04488026_1004128 [Aliiruegeria lutimaris]|uniref:Uncharacterized protein n=2 Tax=Aliiruegeria lutimaris TaxID=571298 RepID=A0A1G8LSL0_9RHOB|nr:hypothetical protein SAMN04488026_1004128 [Aliiruegeria lutimaris]